MWRAYTVAVAICSACSGSGASIVVGVDAYDGFTEGADGSSVFGQGARATAHTCQATGQDAGPREIVETIVGPCTIVYNPAPADGGARTKPQCYSAGTIKITGGTRALTLVPGANDVDGEYSDVSVQELVFGGGETVTVHASGGGGLFSAGIPAFTVMLTMPPKLTITSPPKPSPQQGLGIDATRDLTVTWSPAGDQQMNIELMQPADLSPWVDMVCTFPSSDGTGTIPAAALAKLPGGGIFNAWSSTVSEKTVEGSTIDVSASYPAVWPNDTIVNVGVGLL